MNQDLFDHFSFIDKADNSHQAAAALTKGIQSYPPALFDQRPSCKQQAIFSAPAISQYLNLKAM